MQNTNDSLSDKQYQINRKSTLDSEDTDLWLRNKGLNPTNFASIDLKLIQAFIKAKSLIDHGDHYLTCWQRDALELFIDQMSHANTRRKLKTHAAYPILNISSKINRKIFKDYRQIKHTQ